MRKAISGRPGLLLGVVAAAILAGCATPDDDGAAFDDATRDEVKQAVESEGPIEVIENNWTSQLVQTRLGFRVLQEMGADVSIEG